MASVAKRQASVLKSKYPKYCLSGGMRKHVMIAKSSAISITIFFRANPPVFLKSSFFTAHIISLPFQNRMRF